MKENMGGKKHREKQWNHTQLFENTNEIDQSLSRVIQKKKRERLIITIRSEKGDISKNTTGIQMKSLESYKAFCQLTSIFLWDDNLLKDQH